MNSRVGMRAIVVTLDNLANPRVDRERAKSIGADAAVIVCKPQADPNHGPDRWITCASSDGAKRCSRTWAMRAARLIRAPASVTLPISCSSPAVQTSGGRPAATDFS